MTPRSPSLSSTSTTVGPQPLWGHMLASSLELKTGASVMAIGGFTGADNSPTLAQFQDYVADGQVRYFIPGSRGGPPGGRSGTAGTTSRRG